MEGNNYSVLLQTIEDNISEQIERDGNTNDDFDAGNLSEIVFRTRKRIRDNGYPVLHLNEKNGKSQLSVTDSLLISAELDELRIINEQLIDSIKSKADETDRERERIMRQMEFLEKENTQLRGAVNSRNEKYYEEKKKWQSKIRSLELMIDEMKLASHDPKVESAIPSTAPRVSYENSNHRMEELEELLKTKSQEVLSLQLQNNKLNGKCLSLEQQLMTQNITDSAIEMNSITNSHIGELRKQNNELERQLKKQNKEINNINNQLQNQKLLQQEILSLESRLKYNEKQMESLNNLQILNETLQKEKEQWNFLFQDIIHKNIDLYQSIKSEYYNSANNKNNSNDNNSDVMDKASSNITPEIVLKAFSELQKQYSILLSKYNDNDISLNEVKKKIVKLENHCKTADVSKEDALFKLERCENQLRLQQQQVKLYAREVLSLRALLNSFDAEFRFGKPDVSDMLRMKDEIITSLRSDIDACREETNKVMSTAMQAVTLSAEITKLQSQLQRTDVTEPSESKKADNEEVAKLREQVSDLQAKLEAAQQAFGIDYIPGKTKVSVLRSMATFVSSMLIHPSPTSPFRASIRFCT